MLAQGINYSTLLGGGGIDRVLAVGVDGNGHVTVAGQTDPPPVGAPAAQRMFPYAVTDAGSRDVFVARLDPSRTGLAQLLWCTAISGIGTESPTMLAVSPDGLTVTVVGLTRSQTNFPVTPNALQPAKNGNTDAFVVQLDGTGAITYCSFFGGNGDDWATGVAIDAGGRIVLAGITNSTVFPTIAGAYQPAPAGGQDAFVAILDPSLPPGQQLVHSTLLGGFQDEGPIFSATMTVLDLTSGGVAVAPNGNVVVTGHTASPMFPTTLDAVQTWHAGGTDVFVSCFDATLSMLLYSTLLGGTADDYVQDLVATSTTGVALGGFTTGGWPTFPTTPCALQSNFGGIDDAFLSVLDMGQVGAAGLTYSTLLGGSWSDLLTALAVEDSGVITAVGSSNGGLAGTPGAHVTTPSPQDTMIVRLDPRGCGPTTLHHLSFLNSQPQPGFERPFAMALHGDGMVTLVGFLSVPQLPGLVAFPTQPNGLQFASNGGADEGYIVTFDPLPANARRRGVSCPTCGGPIWLQVNSNPEPGNAGLAVLGNGAPPWGLGAVVFGVQGTLPLLNCTLWLQPVASLILGADAEGAWRLPLPLPPGFVLGTGLGMQSVWLSAPYCPNGGPLGASHALLL